MKNEARFNAIVDEIHEVETIEELDALLADGGEYAEEQYAPYFSEMKAKLQPVETAAEETAGVEPAPQPEDLAAVVAAMLQELQELRARQAVAAPATKAARVSRKYRLLKTDVSWSTKPQVHAVMAIIAAHAAPGAVLDESDIVEMMEANVAVLNTRQGGKRIWDYYKGGHNEGLLAHGNVEKI